MTRIAVIGAGITGVTTTSSPKDRGNGVTLFDRNRYAAMQTSFADGGQRPHTLRRHLQDLDFRARRVLH